MKVLAWLAFPLLATVVAMGWAGWRGRGQGPQRYGPQGYATQGSAPQAPARSGSGRASRRSGAFAAVDDFRQFSEAMAAPRPAASLSARPAAVSGPRRGWRGLLDKIAGIRIAGQGS